VALPYPPETKAQALELLEQGQPLKDVMAATGVPKSTLSRWAQAAGIATLHPERAAAAREARAFSYGELVSELTALLGNIAKTGAKVTYERLAALVDPETGEIDLEGARDEDLAKIVGSWTRAIHDLQLLSGKATERHDLGSDVDRQIEDLVEQMAGMDPARDQGDVYTP
jgi:transposase-like protein